MDGKIIVVEFLSGIKAGQKLVFELDANPKIVVGTDPQLPVHLPAEHYPGISRRHFSISHDAAAGSFTIADSSREGTFRNGERFRLEVDSLAGGAVFELGTEKHRLKLASPVRAASRELIGKKTSDPPAAPTPKTRHARSMIAFGLLILAALGSLAWFGQKAWRDNRLQQRVLAQSNAELQRNLALTTQQMEQSVDEVNAHLARTRDEFQSNLLDVDESINAARIEAENAGKMAKVRHLTDSERFLAVARTYERAVAQVRGAATATAFAIGPQVFATNAHVAQPVFEGLNRGESTWLYPNKGGGKRLRVTRAIAHPKFSEASNAPGGANDVGLLFIAEEVSNWFPVAPASELRLVDGGYPVGYIGFPSENLKGGGVSRTRPVGTMKTGIVTTVSDFWLADTPFEQAYLIRHNLGTAGGASGSPIFNRNGQVISIHNGGNYIAQVNGKRLAHSANIQFSQRIDCLRRIWNDYPDE